MRTIYVRNGANTFAYRFDPGDEDRVLAEIMMDRKSGRITREAERKLRRLVCGPPPYSVAPIVGAALVGFIVAAAVS